MATQVDLSIVELVCSRLCHDLVGPVGAATNGIELLREMSSSQADDIIDMTDASARTAWRRLEFFRVAFGFAGGRIGWGTKELSQLATGMLNDSKVKLDWQSDPSIVEVQGRGGKLILNLILLIAEGMPRGGDLRVNLAMDGDDIVTTYAGTGKNAALNPRVLSTAEGKMPLADLDSRVILSHLAFVQAADANAQLAWTLGENSIEAVLRLPQQALVAAAAE